MMATIDFSVIPAPEIIEELDYETILGEMIADLQGRDPSYTEILESDPGVKILEVAAARELILRQRINDALQATLLRYAMGSDMDNLAAFYGVTRLQGEADDALRLRTIERIMGSSSAGGRAWYRFHALAADPRVKDANVSSPASGQVAVAILSKEGEQVPAATGDNLDQLGVAFGVVRTTGESDEAYRARVLAQVLAGGGYGIASPDLVEAVNDRLQADDVRVITDVLTVTGATIVPVNVAAQIWLYPDTPSAVFEGLEDRLRAAFDAQSGLGWDVTQSWLIAQLNPAGVQRVVLTAPTGNVICAPNQAPSLGTVSLTLAGRDR
jgi:phage-related baseplate assembly protein